MPIHVHIVYGCFGLWQWQSQVVVTENVCGPQNLKYLLSGPLQKKFVDLWPKRMWFYLYIRVQNFPESDPPQPAFQCYLSLSVACVWQICFSYVHSVKLFCSLPFPKLFSLAGWRDSLLTSIPFPSHKPWLKSIVLQEVFPDSPSPFSLGHWFPESPIALTLSSLMVVPAYELCVI